METARMCSLASGCRWRSCLRSCRSIERSLDQATEELLRAPLSKSAEDQLDAFFCALIGLWHVQHRGRRSEVVGDLRTGFVLLPAAPSAA